MPRRITRVLFLFVLLLMTNLAVAQAEFSADIVDMQKRDTPTQAKIYFAKDKLRIEPQAASPRGAMAFIVNFATQTSTVLMAHQHMYMEKPAQSQGQPQMDALFQTGDVENACSDWQKIARNQSGTCHKAGGETINGRSTVKYEATNASGDVSYVWLDVKLHFPVKWDGKNSGGELRSIQEGKQPASLFEIPAGFTKMDLGGMMQQR